MQKEQIIKNNLKIKLSELRTKRNIVVQVFNKKAEAKKIEEIRNSIIK